MQSIIYVNPDLNDEIIRELIHFCNESTTVEKVIFLTEKSKNESYYELFEEILYFPYAKKVKIIECVPLPVQILDTFSESNP